MNEIDYLLSFNSVKENFNSMIKAFFIMDSSAAMLGFGGNEIDRNLYSLETGRHNISEIVSELQALPGISNVKYVALYRPYNINSLQAARKFLLELGLDTKSIPDAELRNYFTSLFAGENKYALHSCSAPDENGISPAIISLQTDLLSEAAMQDNSRDITRVDSVTTVGDVTIEHVTFISELDAPEPPEAPAKRRQKGDK